jgi:hypothetical protein
MNVGIIIDFSYDLTHVSFNNYYYAVKNIFDDVKIIKNEKDLDGIDILFIGNDHLESHRRIWENDLFINTCNIKNIKIFVFTAETIISSWYPWNIGIQKNLEKFNNLYQYVIDVDDSIKLHKKMMRGLMSKHYENIINIPKQKKDKCLFLGQIYPERQILLDKLKTVMNIDIISSPPPRLNKWIDYITILSKYRFVLSPLSTCGNSFPLKFYETLLVNSIPIHQVKQNTLEYYITEAKYDDCIYFENIDELLHKLSHFNLNVSYNKPWLEDHIKNILLENEIFY